MRRKRGRFALRAAESLEARQLLAIVINEVHYDSAIKTEPAEFVELFNSGDAAVDLSGWSLGNAVTFQFPQGTQIQPGGYAVVAEDPATVATKWGASSYGPWIGRLSNEGDAIDLRDSDGGLVDQVEYQIGFPWPTAGGAAGHSMQLISPVLDNNLGGSWRSSTGESASEGELLAAQSTWRYFKAFSEASTPVDAWQKPGFNDASWQSGAMPIGYGEDFIATSLDDMRGNYSSVYLRKTFQVENAAEIGALLMQARLDDGIRVWINGTQVLSVNLPLGQLDFNDAASSALENAEFQDFPLPNPASYLVSGTNTIAVHLFNSSREASTDVFFDGRLVATNGGAVGPTPGSLNSAFAENAPPQMRQVEHTPQSPRSGEDVVVTAKITDPNGVGAASLQYQLVNPGSYIALGDAAYQTSWTTLPMRDDGQGGDAVAADGTYSVTLPASLQTHRRLVRYRIAAEDLLGAEVAAPYADDPQPNFAYYVYDGIPDWTGAAQPGAGGTPGAQVTYGADVMNSLPTYQLITKRADHVDSQYIPNSTRGGGYGGDAYLWTGTMVYDGVVYDHIDYRARGGVWRYAMGKNMWKFDFNRGHSFQAYDDYGNPYDTKWDKVNFSAVIQQGDFGYRGEQGLFESVGFKLFNLAGVETPKTNFVQFRIVDRASETGATQYDTDFQGLYLVVEQVDGRFLDEHGMPDGNLYKMEGGTGEANNIGPDGPADRSDLNSFQSTYTNTTPTDDWWRQNLDLESYYSYRSIVEAIHHYDIGDGKNYFYYHNPETNQWSVVPWDIDLTWANNMYGSGNEPFKNRVLNRPEFSLEYKNRLRELRDLLYNAEQTGQLIDEMASHIYTPGQRSMVDADRAMWDYNPILSSGYVNGSKAGLGRFYDIAPGGTFTGMITVLKNYVASRSVYIDTNLAADAQIPNKPTVTSTSPPTYPINQLTFSTTPFSDGTGTFAAMEWRLAEVTDPDNPNYDPTAPKLYEINAAWESGPITTFSNSITIPGQYVEAGSTYRVRVRMQDSTGRWSNWSAPVEFIATPETSPLAASLRVGELMYHPFGDDEEMEFVELWNAGGDTLDLSGAAFVNGIAITLPPQTTLAPGERAILVHFDPAGGTVEDQLNRDRFLQSYGLAQNTPLIGPYTGRLDNAGERLRLVDSGGATILDFRYSDDGAWPGRADGRGSSLELADAAGDPSDSETWRPSNEFGGSPGLAGTGTIYDVVVNEITPAAASGDAIELFNTTNAPIDIGGWYLSDSGSELFKYRIPDGVVLPAGGYRVFDENDFNASPGAVGSFALDGLHGGDVWLVAVDSADRPVRFADHVEFAPVPDGVALGRLPAGVGELFPLVAPTLGGANVNPRVSPLVITEVMYNPTDGPDDQAFEYLEVFNRTAATIDLSKYRFGDGVTFAFPTGAQLSPGSAAIIVSFHPDNAAQAQAFRERYELDEAVTLFGPWEGSLDNGGERIELLEAGAPPPGEPAFTPYYLVDRVIFDDDAPWPNDADGNGYALARLAADNFGDFANSWEAAVPTPGEFGFAPIQPGDTNGDGVVDLADLNNVRNHFGEAGPGVLGDTNQDDVVDLTDLNNVRNHFGESLSNHALRQPTGTNATPRQLASMPLTGASRLMKSAAAQDVLFALLGNAEERTTRRAVRR
jgi:hypothetical protein